MQIIFAEMQEKVGVALLPVLQKFTTWLSSPGGTKALESIIVVLVDLIEKGIAVVEWVVQYKDALIPLTATIGALTLALKIVTTAFGVYTTVTAGLAARNAAIAASNTALAASNTAVATTATAATTAMRLFAAAAAVGAVLSIPGSAAQPGTVPSTMPRPADLPNTPVVPPQQGTGIPGFGGTAVIPPSPVNSRPVVPTVKPTATTKPTVVINNSNTVNVKNSVTSGKDIVSSLQNFQNQTGVSRILLK
jgi:hypothetical protein